MNLKPNVSDIIFEFVECVIWSIVRVADHGRLPLAVLLFIPVVRLLRVRTADQLRRILVPAFRHGGVRVGDLRIIVPIIWLLCISIFDVPRSKYVEIVLDGAGLNLLAINPYLVGAGRSDDKSVEMTELIILAPDVLLDEFSFTTLGQAEVNLFGPGPTDVWAEHDIIGRITIHLCWIDTGGEKLNITTAAIDILLMLHLVLDHQSLAFV